MERLFPSFAEDVPRAPLTERSTSSPPVLAAVPPDAADDAPLHVLPLPEALVAATLLPANGAAAELPKLRSARRAHSDAFERAYLLAALAATNQNVTRAAKLAGVSRQQIQRLMIKHDVRRGEPRAQ